MPIITLEMFSPTGQLPENFIYTYKKAGFGSTDPGRARGPFEMFLMAEKGYSFQDILDINDEKKIVDPDEMVQIYNEFVKALEDHPVLQMDNEGNTSPHENADANSALYSRWFRGAMEKMRDYKFPSKDTLKTPEDVYAYLDTLEQFQDFSQNCLQEFNHQFSRPGTGSKMLIDVGMESLNTLSTIDAYSKATSMITGNAQKDKFKVMFFPQTAKLINETEGMSIGELSSVKIFNISAEMSMISSRFMMDITMDMEADDVKYGQWLKKNISLADGDLSDMNDPLYDDIRDSLKLNVTKNGQVKQMDLNDLKTEIAEEAAEGISDNYNKPDLDFMDKLTQEQINDLVDQVPDMPDYDNYIHGNEAEAVHQLFIKTAGHMFDVQTGGLIGSQDMTIYDQITIDGRSLKDITEEKYPNLENEQKIAVAECLYAAAFIDKDMKLEYTPFVYDAKTGVVRASTQPVIITQTEKNLDRTYSDSVDRLFVPHADVAGESFENILKNAENAYQKLYADSNRLTDSSEFNKMLGSFKELHELNNAIAEAMNAKNTDKIDQAVFDHLNEHHGYTKAMITDLLKESAANCSGYITAKNASGSYRSTDKGNDRLMCAAGFLNDIDPALAKKDFGNIKLKDAQGKKTVRKIDDVNDSKKRMSFKDLMKDGSDKRKNAEKTNDNAARGSKKRMNERVQKSGQQPQGPNHH